MPSFELLTRGRSYCSRQRRAVWPGRCRRGPTSANLTHLEWPCGAAPASGTCGETMFTSADANILVGFHTDRYTALSASPPPMAKSERLVLRASDLRWAVRTPWKASIGFSKLAIVWRFGGGAAFTKPSAVNMSWPTFPRCPDAVASRRRRRSRWMAPKSTCRGPRVRSILPSRDVLDLCLTPGQVWRSVICTPFNCQGLTCKGVLAAPVCFAAPLVKESLSRRQRLRDCDELPDLHCEMKKQSRQKSAEQTNTRPL